MPVNIRISPKHLDALAGIANAGFERLPDDQLEMIQGLFSRIVLAAVEKVHADENNISATLTVAKDQKTGV